MNDHMVSYPKKNLENRYSEWRPIAICYVKLNVDVGFRNSDDSYGFIIWNAIGQLILAGAGPLHSISSVLQAELMALWHSVKNVL